MCILYFSHFVMITLVYIIGMFITIIIIIIIIQII
jgi:hypothetical protein